MNNTTMHEGPSTDIFPSEFLLTNVGAPFVIGLAVGYFAKKMLRVALLLGGAAIVLLFISEYYGVIILSRDKFGEVVKEATGGVKSFGDFLVTRLGSITSKGVSGVGGFFVGLKLG
jgi:uncharacterized membrane protein (Fun14 family)